MDQQPAVPNINILSFKQQESTGIGKFLNWSLQYGRVIIILTEFIVIAAFISRFYFDRKLADLNDAVDVKTAYVEQSVSIERDFLKLQSSLELIGQLSADSKNYATLMTNVNSFKTQDIIVREFAITGKALSFSAQAGSVQSLNTFLQNLSASKKFEEISLEDVALKEGKIVMTLKMNVLKEAFQ